MARITLKRTVAAAGGIATLATTGAAVVAGGPWAWAMAVFYIASEIIGATKSKDSGVLSKLKNMGMDS